MSTVLHVGPSWPGFAKISRIVIFGDSYSSTLSHDRFGRGVGIVPTAQQPLGADYPGQPEGLWNEPGEPNWVGHLLTRYRPGARFKPKCADQDPAWLQAPLLVHDYAFGGAEVADMLEQLRYYLKSDGTRALRQPTEALFVTWIGINDCGDSNGVAHTGTVKTLFRLQETLYEQGGRNFLFLDVPPIHRSPAIPKSLERDSSASYETWNRCLSMAATDFASSHPDATVMICSANAVFDAILDFPEDYGFDASDTRQAAGGIWYDHLHPTSAMHEHIASHMADFLGSVPPSDAT